MSRLRFAAGPVLVPVLLLLSACEREVIPSESGQAIRFEVADTKAGVEFKTGDSMLVWARDDNGRILMDGQKVTLTENGWEYSPLKFWPDDREIDFFAVSPGSPEYFGLDWQPMEVALRCAEDASADLLCSSLVSAHKGETVRLHFMHTLSRVTLKGKLRRPLPLSRSIRVKHISIGPLPMEGIWSIENRRILSTSSSKTFHQNLEGGFITEETAVPLTDFFLFPVSEADIPDATLEVEWEILLKATGATVYAHSDRIPLDTRDLTTNTEISFSLSLDGRYGLIDFADEETKRICVASFDTDADGEISYEEAAAVTDLGSGFRGSIIGSFDELKWFTGLTTLPNLAFKDCGSLVSITIPDNVSSIGDYAFSGCLSLPCLAIPDSITEIPDGLVKGCRSLTSLAHGSEIIRIGEYAFTECASLESYSISPTVTELGVYAFKGAGLVSIDLSTNPIPLSVGIFQDCPSLESITFHNFLERIPDQAFQRCTALQNLALPTKLKTIGMNAFEGCTALVKIDLPNTMEYIDYAAFANCANVKDIISRRSKAPEADSKAFGWIDENGVSHYAGSAVQSRKNLTRLKLSTGYKKEPWSLLTGEAVFFSNTVYSIN